MSKKPIFEPRCQIRPKGLILYEQLANRADFATPETKFESGKPRYVYSGIITAGAKKRMKKAIQTLVAISENQVVHHDEWKEPIRFRLSFLTLTLPAEQEQIEDNEIIKQCLQPFLREVQRKHRMKHYIWKAERQKNGNIHFHITSNIFIHYKSLQDHWNFYMDRIGLLSKFESKYGHKHPHSTEVKAVKNINQIERYLQKYYMKNLLPSEKIYGKLWDCSLSLKSVAYPTLTINNSLFDHLNEKYEQFKFQTIELEKCSIMWFKEWQRKGLLNDEMSNVFNNFLNEVRNFKRIGKN